MYDTSYAISERALLALESACQQDECADALILLRPRYDHLGEASVPLLLRLLARPSGFAYLESTGFVERVRSDFQSARTQVAPERAHRLSLRCAPGRMTRAAAGTGVLVPARERGVRPTSRDGLGAVVGAAVQHDLREQSWAAGDRRDDRAAAGR